jgi:AbrB family looped-hinge helix DNA binding protein
MLTTVTSKNMITIPAEIGRQMGIKPGYRLDWSIAKREPETLKVKIVPDRATLAERLLGAGRKFAGNRDLIAELIREREEEDRY